MTVRITLVPHTHWDREWYAPFHEFRDRLVAMMDALLDLGAAGFPHFHLDGQVAMVDDYLEVRPERERDLRRLAAEGRLSLGPWYTQMDGFLVSGESHVRNLETGLARARELGPALEVGYLPDQFGHVGQMPQILRMFGIDRAVVWRGVPRAIDKTTFRWEAPDGSAVTTEYMAFGYFNGEAYRRIADPAELAGAIRRSVDELRPFLALDRILVMVGADHTGPDPTLPERVAAAAALADGVEVSVGGIAAHLQGREPEGLPVWRGELRSSARAHLLPNVVSARVHHKRRRGQVEALLERYAEPLAALVPGFGWPAERLARSWRLLLWNGAHDSACGCSHDQVARDVEARFAEAQALAEDVADEALAALGRRVRAEGTLVFNPSPFERDGVPGLGWRVAPVRREPREAPVDPRVEGGWVVADQIAFSFRDEPDVGDLYNFCPAEDGQEPAPPDRLELDGPQVLAAWEGLEVRLRLVRRADEPFLRLEGAVRNERPDHRLRLLVRLLEPARGSVAGSPFELVAREPVSEGSDLEAPSPTWPARGVVLAGGVACLHEGVFEYEVDHDRLAVTLLRCVGTISRRSIATRPWPAGPDVPTPDAQMLGETAFALGLGRRRATEGLLEDWERFALPLRAAPAVGGGDLPAAGSLLEVTGEAVLSSVRRVDGVLEVRVWNPRTDRPARATVAGRPIHLGPARIETMRLP